MATEFLPESKAEEKPQEKNQKDSGASHHTAWFMKVLEGTFTTGPLRTLKEKHQTFKSRQLFSEVIHPLSSPLPLPPSAFVYLTFILIVKSIKKVSSSVDVRVICAAAQKDILYVGLYLV